MCTLLHTPNRAYWLEMQHRDQSVNLSCYYYYFLQVEGRAEIRGIFRR